MPRRPIAFALLLWYLPACTAWQVAEGISPEHLIAKKHPDVVRVTRPDSSHMVLYEPRIAGDSLSGIHYKIFFGRDLSVAVSDVTQIETRKADAGKTLMLVIGISLVAVALVVVEVSAAAWDFGH